MQFVSFMTTSKLMLYMEKVSLFIVRTICNMYMHSSKYAELLNVKHGGICSNYFVLIT
jgi:hypothetical protein